MIIWVSGSRFWVLRGKTLSIIYRCRVVWTPFAYETHTFSLSLAVLNRKRFFAWDCEFPCPTTSRSLGPFRVRIESGRAQRRLGYSTPHPGPRPVGPQLTLKGRLRVSGPGRRLPSPPQKVFFFPGSSGATERSSSSPAASHSDDRPRSSFRARSTPAQTQGSSTVARSLVQSGPASRTRPGSERWFWGCLGRGRTECGAGFQQEGWAPGRGSGRRAGRRTTAGVRRAYISQPGCRVPGRSPELSETENEESAGLLRYRLTGCEPLRQWLVGLADTRTLFKHINLLFVVRTDGNW